MIIYKATNIQNGKVYIGQTTNTLEYRKSQHFRESKSEHRKNTYFHNAISKYGEESFVFEEIDSAESIEELNIKEEKWIRFYRSTEKRNGYNLDSGGKNCKKSQSTKDKISACKKELWKNDEVAARMRRGLQAGCETMKKRKGSTNITKICECCGKEFVVPRYEQNHKYCSLACANKINVKNATEAAVKTNISRRVSRDETMKLDIINWCKEHKALVTSCPMNKVSTVYEPMRQFIEDIYGVKDIRIIIKSVIGSYNKKDFAQAMKSLVSV